MNEVRRRRRRTLLTTTTTILMLLLTAAATVPAAATANHPQVHVQIYPSMDNFQYQPNEYPHLRQQQMPKPTTPKPKKNVDDYYYDYNDDDDYDGDTLATPYIPIRDPWPYLNVTTDETYTSDNDNAAPSWYHNSIKLTKLNLVNVNDIIDIIYQRNLAFLNNELQMIMTRAHALNQTVNLPPASSYYNRWPTTPYLNQFRLKHVNIVGFKLNEDYFPRTTPANLTAVERCKILQLNKFYDDIQKHEYGFVLHPMKTVRLNKDVTATIHDDDDDNGGGESAAAAAKRRYMNLTLVTQYGHEKPDILNSVQMTRLITVQVTTTSYVGQMITPVVTQHLPDATVTHAVVLNRYSGSVKYQRDLELLNKNNYRINLDKMSRSVTVVDTIAATTVMQTRWYSNVLYSYI